MSETQIQLPRYKCHKEVAALQIDYVDGADLVFKDTRYAPMYVGPAWIDKFNPQPGGYLVVYADGYRSYSPAKAFEEGYTLVE